MNNTSIAEHYSRDHDRLDELFRQYHSLKPTDRTRAIQCFREFKTGLEQHIAWEEELLFPPFENKTGESCGPTQVMRWEHREIRKYLDTIAEKQAQDCYDTQAEELGLQTVLGQHNQKEENIFYPRIDQFTDAAERAGIFARMGVSSCA